LGYGASLNERNFNPSGWFSIRLAYGGTVSRVLTQNTTPLFCLTCGFVGIAVESAAPEERSGFNAEMPLFRALTLPVSRATIT